MASDFRLKEQLPNLTNRIVATYSEVGSINHLGHCPLPQYEAVVEILDDLKEVLYPGYRRRVGLHIGNVTYHAGDLIDGLHDKLTVQIGRGLQHEARVDGARTARRDATTTRPKDRRSRSSSWNAFPNCGACWRRTCRPPTTATRPARVSTK